MGIQRGCEKGETEPRRNKNAGLDESGFEGPNKTKKREGKGNKVYKKKGVDCFSNKKSPDQEGNQERTFEKKTPKGTWGGDKKGGGRSSGEEGVKKLMIGTAKRPRKGDLKSPA